ncbi:ComF family protein [bacterium]|nr:ComF family protein [bacterium]
MWNYVETLLDFILPRKEHAARTQSRSVDDFLLTPEKHTLLGSTITTLFSYKSPAVDDCIRALKYEQSDHAARLLAQMLGEYLREEITTLRFFSKKPILLVPLPLHRNRIQSRGFNQIEKVLKQLSQEFQNGTYSTLATEVLHRSRDTKQQTKLSRQERLSNVAGAFDVTSPEVVKGAQIILIDDVTTTGATLVNAATPLKKAGAEVTLIALARA